MFIYIYILIIFNKINIYIYIYYLELLYIEKIGERETMYIRDVVRIQIAPNSLTVLGFYPSSNLKEKFKDYKSL